MSVAVVIPVYNNFSYLYRCLKSLSHNPAPDMTIFVIDDGSNDLTEDIKQNVVGIDRRIKYYRDENNFGLTQRWNDGMRLAKSFDYIVLANQDVKFTKGWWKPVEEALNSWDLVGPKTNAPGLQVQQRINVVSDDQDYLNNIAEQLPGGVIEGRINGFFMVAKASTWWNNSFDDYDVFDPSYKMEGNEVEFQQRFNGRIGTVCNSLIFHYRSTSRGLGCPALDIGCYRKPDLICYTSYNPSFDHPIKRDYECLVYEGLDRHEARRIKCLSHKITGSEYSMWIDANLDLLVDPYYLIDNYLRDSDIATFAHPKNYCIYEEAADVLLWKKAKEEDVRKQVMTYYEEGYPIGNCLAETRIVIRRHTKQIKDLNEMWWGEISKHTLRDQLSFNYCAWKLGVRINYFDRSLHPGKETRMAYHQQHRYLEPPVIFRTQ